MEGSKNLKRTIWNGMPSLKLVLSEKMKEKAKIMYANGITQELLGDNPPEISRVVFERYSVSRVEDGIVFRIREKTLGPLKMAIPAGVDPKGKIAGWCELNGTSVRPDSLVLIKDDSVLFEGNKVIIFDPVGMMVIVNVSTGEFRLEPFSSSEQIQSYTVFEEKTETEEPKSGIKLDSFAELSDYVRTKREAERKARKRYPLNWVVPSAI